MDMKQKFAKPLAVLLSAGLIAGSVGATVYAANSTQAEQTPTASASTAPTKTAPCKDETVYVLAGADGSVQKIIVSDWIKNQLGSDSLTDTGTLTNVETTKGDATYTMNGDSMRVWNAQGSDVYCKGTVEQELPVSMKVSYRLDGKAISAEELAGQSGHVTIRYEYTNNQYETVQIDGKATRIAVPFAMLTGMLLDNDVFTNVEVSNGRLINDGSRTIVAGLAFPGLQDDLALDRDTLELPDYVEISADVQHFEMMNTVTVATNELFNKLDTDSLDSLDDLTDQLGELTDGMNALLDGSSQLYDGLNTLLDKSGELIDGINQLADGAASLKSGTADLKSGAASLLDGTKKLSGGLNKLAANNDTLNGGAKKVFETLLDTANTQLAAAGLTIPALTIENYAKTLDAVIASLDPDHVAEQAQAIARKKVTAAVEAKRGDITAAVTAAVRAQVEAEAKPQVQAAVTQQVQAEVQEGVEAQRSTIEAQVTAAVRQQVEAEVAQNRDQIESGVLASMGMTKKQYDAAVAAGQISEAQQAQVTAAVDAQIAQLVDAQMASDTVQATIASQTDAQIAAAVAEKMASDEIQATIASTTEAQLKIVVDQKMATDEIQATIAEKTDEQAALLIEQNMQSKEVQDQITEALKKAQSGAADISALKASLNEYNTFYTGLYAYTAGVTEANDGASQLLTGAGALSTGANQLDSGAQQLYNGLLSLKSNAPALADGVTQLRDGAMQLSDGLREFNERGVQKLVDAVDGDLNGLLTRVRATADVSKNYRSFSGLTDGMDGAVRFIYRTDAIEAKTE